MQLWIHTPHLLPKRTTPRLKMSFKAWDRVCDVEMTSCIYTFLNFVNTNLSLKLTGIYFHFVNLDFVNFTKDVKMICLFRSNFTILVRTKLSIRCIEILRDSNLANSFLLRILKRQIFVHWKLCCILKI